MSNSILTSIKKLLGIKEEYVHFDEDILMHINAVLATLTQIGVGKDSGFTIVDEETSWEDYISDNVTLLDLVKMYIYMRVKILFDPPQAGSAVESMNKMISEYEWRIYSIVNFKGE